LATATFSVASATPWAATCSLTQRDMLACLDRDLAKLDRFADLVDERDGDGQ
jgi:hypothetical protein